MGTDQSHKNSWQDCREDMPEFPIATKLKVFYRTCHRAVCIVMQYQWWSTCNEMQILLSYCQMQMVFQKFNAVLCSHSLTISDVRVSLGIFDVTFDCWVLGEVSSDVMSTDGSVCIIAILFPACRPI